MTSVPPPVQEGLPASSRRWTVGTLAYGVGGLVALFGWLLFGDLAWSVRDRTVPAAMQIVFRQYDVSDTLIALLFSSIPIVIGLVSGPLVSYLSDNHRGPRGRRIPFLLWATPFIVVSIVGLAFSPQIGAAVRHLPGGHFIAERSAVLGFLIAFWLVFEIACGVANMVFAGLVNDVVPQAFVGRFYGLFRVISLLVGIGFNYWVFGHVETRSALIFLGVGVLYGVGFTLMCLKVKEGSYPPPPARVPGAPVAVRFLEAAKGYLRLGYSHPYYLCIFVAGSVAGLVMQPFGMYSVFYAKSLGMTMTAYGKCVALTYAISICLAYPLGALSDRLHPLRMSILTLAGYALASLWFAYHVRDTASFSVALVVQGVVSGCFYTVSASLPLRLFPREGFVQINSAGGILGSMIQLACVPAIGLFLDRSGHDYRNTFFMGAGIGLIAIAVNLVLYFGFASHWNAPREQERV